MADEEDIIAEAERMTGRLDSLAITLPPGFAAMIAAITIAMQSAIEGECRDCSCDVCVSLRGVNEGLQLGRDDDRG